MPDVKPNLDAVLHNVIKKYMSKRQQGYCMSELRDALNLTRSPDRHASKSAEKTSCLPKYGVPEEMISLVAICQELRKDVSDLITRHGSTVSIFLEALQKAEAVTESACSESDHSDDDSDLDHGTYIGASIILGVNGTVAIVRADDNVLTEVDESDLDEVFGKVTKGMEPGAYSVLFRNDWDFVDSDGSGPGYLIPVAVRLIPTA